MKFYKTRFKREDDLFKHIDKSFKYESSRIIGGIEHVLDNIRKKERLNMYDD